MSWLLKRAEGLLNDIDNVAASKLGNQLPTDDDAEFHEDVVDSLLDNATNSVNTSSAGGSIAPGFSAAHSRPVAKKPSTSKPALDDDQLFSFLNQEEEKKQQPTITKKLDKPKPKPVVKQAVKPTIQENNQKVEANKVSLKSTLQTDTNDDVVVDDDKSDGNTTDVSTIDKNQEKNNVVEPTQINTNENDTTQTTSTIIKNENNDSLNENNVEEVEENVDNNSSTMVATTTPTPTTLSSTTTNNTPLKRVIESEQTETQFSPATKELLKTPKNFNHNNDNAVMEAMKKQNDLLKQKVRSLNSQLNVMKREKSELSETVDAALAQVRQLQQEQIAKDKRMEKLKNAESSFDNRVEQLQRDFEQSEAELKTTKQVLESTQAELRAAKTAALQADSNANSTAKSAQQTAQAAHERSEAAEQAREAALREASEFKVLAARRLDELTQLQSQMASMSNELQMERNNAENKIATLNQQLNESNDELESVRIEFDQYKLNARQVLAEGATSPASSDDVATTAEQAAWRSAIDDAKQRVASLQKQLAEARANANAMQRESQQALAAAADAESRAVAGWNAAKIQIEELEETLQSTQQSSLKTKQLLQNEIDSLAQRALSAENELKSLRDTIEQQQQNGDQPHDSSLPQNDARQREELENRLRTMTEALIEKQNKIETVNSEKAYLQLKLEQEVDKRNALERFQKSVRLNTPSADVRPIAELIRRRGEFDDDDDDDDYDDIVDDDDDNGKGDKPVVRKQLTYDVESGGKARRRVRGTPSKRARSFVRKNAINAANALDAFSSATARFLGMSPLARLIVIFYVALLHFWVAYIILSYQPEMHHDGSVGPGGLSRDHGLPKPK